MSDGRADEAPAATVRKAGAQSVELALDASLQAKESRSDDPSARAASVGAKRNNRTEKLAPRSGGDWRHRWPSLISITALIFSGISLYETVLKQADLSVYVGDVAHLSRDKATKAEIIALPVTAANHGARDAVLLGLRLGTDDAPDRYRSSFVGGQNDPFAPWPVPGRGSHSGLVQFHAEGVATTLIVPWVDGPARSYTLCLTVHAEASRPFGLPSWPLEHPPAALRFVLKPAYRFNDADMNNGRWIPLWITGIESIDYQRAIQTGQCRTPV